jgi:flavin reductase (DIM6/NTAB) family NADH-FMN oxidoreductase RutF
MVIAFCPMVRSSTGLRKDTLVNIVREREFVLNFCTEANHEKVNLASSELPYGEDEFKFTGLTPLDAELVRAKRMAESPIHFEWCLRDVLHYGSGAGAGSLVTGEVLRVHIDPALLEAGKIVTARFKPVGRGAGNDWFRTDSVFEMARMMGSQIQR